MLFVLFSLISNPSKKTQTITTHNATLTGRLDKTFVHLWNKAVQNTLSGIGVQDFKRKIFKLIFNALHTNTFSKRRINIHRFAGNAAALHEYLMRRADGGRISLISGCGEFGAR